MSALDRKYKNRYGIVKYMLRQAESERSTLLHTLVSDSAAAYCVSCVLFDGRQCKAGGGAFRRWFTVGGGACGRVLMAAGAMIFDASTMEQVAEIAKRNEEEEVEKRQREDAKTD